MEWCHCGVLPTISTTQHSTFPLASASAPSSQPFLGPPKTHGGMPTQYLHAPGHGSLINEQLQDVDGHNEYRQALCKARSQTPIPAPAHSSILS